MAKYSVEVKDSGVAIEHKFDPTQYKKIGLYKLSNDEVIFYDGTAVWQIPGIQSHFTKVEAELTVKAEIQSDVLTEINMTEKGFIELMDKMVHGGLETGRFKGVK